MTNNIVSTKDIWKWVGLGWRTTCCGLGWVGFQKVDPCPCLRYRRHRERQRRGECRRREYVRLLVLRYFLVHDEIMVMLLKLFFSVAKNKKPASQGVCKVTNVPGVDEYSGANDK